MEATCGGSGMSENKNAKTPADGPEYERGFVEGMQRQMQLHVNRVIKEEPTAWISEGGDVSRSKRYMDEMGFKCNPLYTAPPKQWVGLTAYEIQEIHSGNQHWGSFACAIEQALKEKNHG